LRATSRAVFDGNLASHFLSVQEFLQVVSDLVWCFLETEKAIFSHIYIGEEEEEERELRSTSASNLPEKRKKLPALFCVSARSAL